jgi:hypothetical protein
MPVRTTGTDVVPITDVILEALGGRAKLRNQGIDVSVVSDRNAVQLKMRNAKVTWACLAHIVGQGYMVALGDKDECTVEEFELTLDAAVSILRKYVGIS